MRASLPAGVFLSLLTAASASLGVRELQTFDHSAGDNTHALSQWPADASLPAPSGRPVLLLFAHPLCGCTRATLAELSRVLSETAAHPDVRIFFEPEGGSKAPLWSEASRLPGATVSWDRDGKLAQSFGARTSGIVKLYDAGGQLRFEGGITSARGHEGKSPGGTALHEAILGSQPGAMRFPVFGCALREDRS